MKKTRSSNTADAPHHGAHEQDGRPVMLVGPVEGDRARDTCFGQLPWRICCISSVLEFHVEAFRLQPQVVVCEETLPDGSWRNVLQLTARLPNPAPLIVTSRLADERLWAEVLNLGGYDLLAKPLSKTEVYRAVSLAWQYASRQNCLRTAAGAATVPSRLTSVQ
jgi:FixJ family two-component response regulator